MLGTGEMLIIALVAIIVVDPKKLPDLMKGLGKAVGEFKQMSGEFKRTIERETEAAEFEKRKAEAHEKLYGTGAQAEGQAETQPDAQAQTQHEPQPEEYPAAAAESAPVEFASADAAPVDSAPVESAEEETAPADAVPADAVPAEAAPVEATEAPAQPEPAEPAVADAVASDATPTDSAPADSALTETAPTETGLAHTEQASPVLADAALAEAVAAEAPAAADGGATPPPPPPTGDEAVGEGHSGRMSLFGHLQDLRKRLTRSAIAMLVGFLGCYAFAGQMLKVLMKPMLDALKQSHFIYTLPTEAFFTEMKIAFVAGIFASSPYIFYQIFQFVSPGLYSHEKRWIIPIAFFSALCFTVGAMFGYFVVFPFGFEFFASYTSDILVFTPKLDEYLDFVLKLLFAFGIVFELPLFLFFLARLGIVSYQGLKSKRKYAVLAAFILAAALTPPDAISQTMMAVPLCILYELGIWLAYFFGKKKPAPEPEAEAQA